MSHVVTADEGSQEELEALLRAVEASSSEADRVRYHAPKNAHGSRLRYFFNRLQREARL